MANKSILAAFERMWQHIVAALGTKSDVSHTHNEYLVADDISYVNENFNGIDNRMRDISNTMKSHHDNDDIHITADERTTWNAKATTAYVNEKTDNMNIKTGSIELAWTTTVPYYRQGNIIQLNGSIDIFNQMYEDSVTNIELEVNQTDDNFLYPTNGYVGSIIVEYVVSSATGELTTITEFKKLLYSVDAFLIVDVSPKNRNDGTIVEATASFTGVYIGASD